MNLNIFLHPIYKIYTSEGNKYLHLPGVIVTENITGERRYLLTDGLGSVRQVVDESGKVVAKVDYDPYGNPIEDESKPYGFTGEWWESELGLLHLRVRWYMPEVGIFLSRDQWERDILQPQTLNGFSYGEGNPINLTDPNCTSVIACINGSLEICFCNEGCVSDQTLSKSPPIISCTIPCEVDSIPFCSSVVKSSQSLHFVIEGLTLRLHPAIKNRLIISKIVS